MESDEARCHLATDCFASLMKVTMSLNSKMCNTVLGGGL